MNSANFQIHRASPAEQARIRAAIAAWHAGESLDRDQQAIIDQLLIQNYVDQVAPAASGAA